MRNWVVLSSVVWVGLCSEMAAASLKKEPDSNPCKWTANTQRISLRHIEPGGIGYNQGYSSLDGFFSLRDFSQEVVLPFLDFRFHVFNDGKLAGNAGVGVRYLKNQRIWGANSYYDIRQGQGQVYNQIALGLESLGAIWDFRLNGYLPVGSKRSPFLSTNFDTFSGHSMILKRRYAFAMGGFNGEIGAHFDWWKKVPIYFTAGSYFLHGKSQSTWGGESRLAIDPYKYVRLEGNVSYDHIFKWVGQGQLGLIFSFGGKESAKKVSKGSECSVPIMDLRLAQRVDRHEIIPLDRACKQTLAIDPSTGEPYFFLFVDNESHSQGTWESPYSTLADAIDVIQPGNIIYLLPGSGASYEGGISLGNQQRLWGSGIDYTLTTQAGPITIPAQSASFPSVTLSMASATPAITVFDACEVAGLNITGINGVSGNGAAISGAVFTDTFIHDNTINNVDGVQAFIYLRDCRGNIQVSNNSLLNGGTDGASGIVIDNSTAFGNELNVIIAQNTISNILSGDGIAIAADVGSSTGAGYNIVVASITDNVLDNINSNGGAGLFGFGSGIGLYNDIGGTGHNQLNATISGNALSAITGGSQAVFEPTSGSASGSGIAIYTNFNGVGGDAVVAAVSNNSLDAVIGGVFSSEEGNNLAGIAGGSGIAIYTSLSGNGDTSVDVTISKNALSAITGGGTITGGADNLGVAGGSGIALYSDFSSNGATAITSVIADNTLNGIAGGMPNNLEGTSNFGVCGGSGIGVYTAMNGSGSDTIISSITGNSLDGVSGGAVSITAEFLSPSDFTGNFGVASGSGIAVYTDFWSGGDNTIQPTIFNNQLNAITSGALAVDAYGTNSSSSSIGHGGAAGGSGIAIYTDLSGDGGDVTNASISTNSLTSIYGGNPVANTVASTTTSTSGSGSGGVAGGSGVAVYTDLSGNGNDATTVAILRNTLSGITGGNVSTDASFATAPFCGSGGVAGGSGIAVYTDLGSPQGHDTVSSTILNNTLTGVIGGSASTNAGSMDSMSELGTGGAAGGSGIAVYSNLLGAGSDTVDTAISNNNLVNTQGGTITTIIGNNFGVAGGGGISIYTDFGGTSISAGGSDVITGTISNNTLSNAQLGDAIALVGANNGAIGGSGIGAYTNIYGNGSDHIEAGSSVVSNSLFNVQGGSTISGSTAGVAAGAGVLVGSDLGSSPVTTGNFTKADNSRTNIQIGLAD